MKNLVYLSILVTLVSSQLSAQPIIGRNATISVGYQLASPQGEFRTLLNGTPHGLNASFSKPLLGLPLEYGAGFSWNSVASESRDVNIPDDFGNLIPSHIKLKGNAYTYYVHGRLRPFNGKLRPYGELLAGFRNYSIKSELYSMDGDELASDPITDVEDRNFSWVTGWAVGVQFRLVKGLFIEGRFEKLKGDRSKYVDPSSIQINNNGSYSYELQESETNQLTYSLGLAFSF